VRGGYETIQYESAINYCPRCSNYFARGGARSLTEAVPQIGTDCVLTLQPVDTKDPDLMR